MCNHHLQSSTSRVKHYRVSVHYHTHKCVQVLNRHNQWARDQSTNNSKVLRPLTIVALHPPLLGCIPHINSLLAKARTGDIPLWGWRRMSCHVDVFLVMELAALVFNPQRGLMQTSRASKITKALVSTVMGLALPTRNDIRDAFWRDYLTHAHADPSGTMGDVDSHVRTYAGVYPGSQPLSRAIKHYYRFDRWISYDMQAKCSHASCTYEQTQRVMLHALILPEYIVTTRGATVRETSIDHGVRRAILQSSGAFYQCPTCKDFNAVMRTKLIPTISLPRRIAVALDSSGQLCRSDPPLTLDICEGRVYTLVGVAMRSSAHYRCNILVGEAWFHYDDGGGIPKSEFVQVTGPTFRPFSSYTRRQLYYVLRPDAPGPAPQITVPGWLPTRGGPEGTNAQEEVVD